MRFRKKGWEERRGEKRQDRTCPFLGHTSGMDAAACSIHLPQIIAPLAPEFSVHTAHLLREAISDHPVSASPAPPFVCWRGQRLTLPTVSKRGDLTEESFLPTFFTLSSVSDPVGVQEPLAQVSQGGAANSFSSCKAQTLSLRPRSALQIQTSPLKTVLGTRRKG